MTFLGCHSTNCHWISSVPTSFTWRTSHGHSLLQDGSQLETVDSQFRFRPSSLVWLLWLPLWRRTRYIIYSLVIKAKYFDMPNIVYWYVAYSVWFQLVCAILLVQIMLQSVVKMVASVLVNLMWLGEPVMNAGQTIMTLLLALDAKVSSKTFLNCCVGETCNKCFPHKVYKVYCSIHLSLYWCIPHTLCWISFCIPACSCHAEGSVRSSCHPQTGWVWVQTKHPWQTVWPVYT